MSAPNVSQQLLDQVRKRPEQQQVYKDAAVKGTKFAEVRTQVGKLNLSKEKDAKVNKLYQSIIGHIENGGLNKTQLATFQSQLEDYLVAWGVSVRAVSTKTDYKGIAKLVAAAAVSQE